MQVITIGREQGNSVVISDSNASRYHAQIIGDNGVYRITDLNSTNGTYVNGERIYSERPLMLSDTVRIGSTVVPWQNYFSGSRSSNVAGAGNQPYQQGYYPPPQQQPYMPQQGYVQQPPYYNGQQGVQEKLGCFMCGLCFLIPLLGFILFFVYKSNNKQSKANSAIIAAIIGFVIGLILQFSGFWDGFWYGFLNSSGYYY